MVRPPYFMLPGDKGNKDKYEYIIYWGYFCLGSGGIKKQGLYVRMADTYDEAEANSREYMKKYFGEEPPEKFGDESPYEDVLKGEEDGQNGNKKKDEEDKDKKFS